MKKKEDKILIYYCILFQYAALNLLWVAWNAFVICIYLEVGGMLKRVSKYNFIQFVILDFYSQSSM